MNLNKLSQEIYQANKEKGFWDNERNIGELLMLITSELGEALEAHRKGKKCYPNVYLRKLHDGEDLKSSYEDTIKGSFEEEIADAMIRLLDMCGGLNIDIDFHVQEKLKYNRTRERTLE